MSKFYGSITGSAKTAATRCGSKKSGIESHTRGWDQGIRVTASVQKVGPGRTLERESFEVYLTGGSNGKSNDIHIGTLVGGGGVSYGHWIPAKTEGGTQ